MAGYILDTDTVIAAINARPAHVRSFIEGELQRGTTMAISSVTLSELWYGAAKSQARSRNEAAVEAFLSGPIEVLDFTPDDARTAGRQRASLPKKGMPVGPYDLMIAAQAINRSATLVTHNGREFCRFRMLRVEDWIGQS